MTKKSATILRVVTVPLILILAFYVALSPNLVYAPVPRIILYFLVSLLPAILLSAESAARFELSIKNFYFFTTGAAAIMFALLFILTWLSKPEQQIAVYHVFDQQGQRVELDKFEDAVDIPVTREGYSVTKFVDRNTIVVIFPEQVGEVELTICRFISCEQRYSGKIGYAGNREANLILGRDLKPNQ